METVNAPVAHRQVEVDGIDTFYREAGPADAPVVLLPHGYPASSYAYRNLMAALGDRWRLVAPDLPGFGYSATPSPEHFRYSFDGYSDFLQRFVSTVGLDRYVIWLHDYGSQFGLRLAMTAPERVAGLVIQNGDIHPDEFGPKYDALRELWEHPGPDARRAMAEHVNLAGFRDEFAGELPVDVRDRVAPDVWTLHWALMSSPERVANLVRLLEDQPTTLDWMPRQRAYLREHRPPTLIVWGPHDGYMPEASARAYHRDLPDAELHLLDGGHWLLETHLGEVVPLVRTFLDRVNA
ncbi:alpha/beta fold hydrolase [Agromyces subbeticus]|uniref:alpha/beta fold hydrolase n=1 Tax=Agromyces subbeticus TaxID=293890 RepID=UPI0003B5C263|nr:alpha/beta hydrolase [Agromyces subbeticus]